MATLGDTKQVITGKAVKSIHKQSKEPIVFRLKDFDLLHHGIPAHLHGSIDFSRETALKPLMYKVLINIGQWQIRLGLRERR